MWWTQQTTCLSQRHHEWDQKGYRNRTQKTWCQRNVDRWTLSSVRVERWNQKETQITSGRHWWSFQMNHRKLKEVSCKESKVTSSKVLPGSQGRWGRWNACQMDQPSWLHNLIWMTWRRILHVRVKEDLRQNHEWKARDLSRRRLHVDWRVHEALRALRNAKTTKNDAWWGVWGWDRCQWSYGWNWHKRRNCCWNSLSKSCFKEQKCKIKNCREERYQKQS